VLNGAGRIVSFAEERKKTVNDEGVTLPVSVQAGETSHFLFLQGHWPYTAKSDQGVYTYENKSPTLLQAGFVSAPITRGNNVISIAVRTLVADTAFVPAAALKVKGVEPKAVGAVSHLIPGEWSLTWTIKQGWVDEDDEDKSRAEGNGFEALVNARKILYPSTAIPAFKSRKGLVDDKPVDATSLTVSGNVISLTQKNLEASGVTHYANFNLEYVPFGLTEKDGGWADWAKYNAKSEFKLNEGGPVWIIRNGINDLAQDGNTKYGEMGKTPAPAKNGNGAVNYKVLAANEDLDSDGIPNGQELQWGMDPNEEVADTLDSDDDGFSDVMEATNGFDPYDAKDNPSQGGPGSLEVKVVTGDSESKNRDGTTAYIQFITGGYSGGTAKGYYKAVAHNAAAPVFTDYAPLIKDDELANDLISGLNEDMEVDINGLNGEIDVYVIIMKDGNVSLPVAIPLKTTIEVGFGEI
jgi:hypothetical protein